MHTYIRRHIHMYHIHTYIQKFGHRAVRSEMLQCVAVCCSVLRWGCLIHTLRGSFGLQQPSDQISPRYHSAFSSQAPEYQKSPTHTQKSLNKLKRNLNTLQTAIHTLERALYTLKRALHTLKRGHTQKKLKHTQSARQPYTHSKEPYTH